MKKIVTLSFAVLALSLASCKKDRTCTCVSTPSSGGNPTTTTTKMYSVKKSEAREKCIGGQTTTENSGISITGSDVKCTLK